MSHLLQIGIKPILTFVVHFFLFLKTPQQWLKTGRRVVPGSTPGRACQPSRSEDSMVFTKTRVNMF